MVYVYIILYIIYIISVYIINLPFSSVIFYLASPLNQAILQMHEKRSAEPLKVLVTFDSLTLKDLYGFL